MSIYICLLYTISKLIQNPKNHFISTREYTQTPTSEKKPFSPVWKCRTNISSGLTVQFPYLEKKPPNRVNTEMEGFFPLYNIFEKKKHEHVYPMQSMGWKGWKLKKRAEMKRGPHVLFLLFFLFRTGVFRWILFAVIRSGMYIIFMEFGYILTPWFIEIWLNPKWMLRYRAKM